MPSVPPSPASRTSSWQIEYSHSQHNCHRHTALIKNLKQAEGFQQVLWQAQGRKHNQEERPNRWKKWVERLHQEGQWVAALYDKGEFVQISLMEDCTLKNSFFSAGMFANSLVENMSLKNPVFSDIQVSFFSEWLYTKEFVLSAGIFTNLYWRICHYRILSFLIFRWVSLVDNHTLKKPASL